MLHSIPIQVVLAVAIVARSRELGLGASEVRARLRLCRRDARRAREPADGDASGKRCDDEKDYQRSIHTAMMPVATDIAFATPRTKPQRAAYSSRTARMSASTELFGDRGRRERSGILIGPSIQQQAQQRLVLAEHRARRSRSARCC